MAMATLHSHASAVSGFSSACFHRRAADRWRSVFVGAPGSSGRGMLFVMATTTIQQHSAADQTLRSRRLGLGLTQARLADLAGLSLASVSNVEHRAAIDRHKYAASRVAEVLSQLEAVTFRA